MNRDNGAPAVSDQSNDQHFPVVLHSLLSEIAEGSSQELGEAPSLNQPWIASVCTCTLTRFFPLAKRTSLAFSLMDELSE